MWVKYRTVSNNSESPELVPLTDKEIMDYLAKPGISWDAAGNNDVKLTLIATQKWLNYNIIQPIEAWSEIRRLDKPVLSFLVDQQSAQKQPPYRWLYPSSEKTYNAENFTAVAADDNTATKIFWDLK